MTKTFQEKALETAQYGTANHEYPFLCLTEEAGEVIGKFNKYIRKHDVNMNDAVIAACSPTNEKEFKLREDVIKELGDLRWNLANACSELGITERELEDTNQEKLRGRVARGTIDGSGDNR